MLPIIHIMGTTCSGKGTFCEYAKTVLGEHLYVIGIGAILRKRHPPEYFKGLAAMESTEAEVWAIYEEEMDKAMRTRGVDMIFVDGQPRLPGQVHRCLSYKNAFTDFRFVMLHASAEARRRRIDKRFPDPIPLPAGASYSKDDVDALNTARASRELAEARITNDNIQLFDVLAELALMDQYVTVCRTDGPAGTYMPHLLSLICGGVKNVH